MPESPKTNAAPTKSADASWAEDQAKREYYYDDAHGYETFVDDDGEDAIDTEIEITQEPGGIDEK